MSEPTPLSAEQEPDFLSWLVARANEDRVYDATTLFPQAVEYGRQCEAEIQRKDATVAELQREIAALKGALEAKEREMLAEHSSAMQALLRWCAEDTPEDIRKGWEQESHEALRALAAGRPR